MTRLGLYDLGCFRETSALYPMQTNLYDVGNMDTDSSPKCRTYILRQLFQQFRKLKSSSLELTAETGSDAFSVIMIHAGSYSTIISSQKLKMIGFAHNIT